MSGVIYRPPTEHNCHPGWISKPLPEDHPARTGGATHHMIPPRSSDYPKGTVWECDCGQIWISCGMRKPYARGGHFAAALEWKREGRWAKRRRLRRQFPRIEGEGICMQPAGGCTSKGGPTD